MAQKLDNQTVGNIGLYYVCYSLSRLGWNVMPTARNARGIDLVIYNFDASCKLTVQVKTLSRRPAVPLGSHLDHLYADFVVICTDVATDRGPMCFVLTPDEVRDRAVRDKKGKRHYWLPRANYADEQFRENWSRFGDG